MAVRINVTAVRDCPKAEAQAVFAEVIKPACGPDDCDTKFTVEPTEHNGWLWFNTSVWGVSADDLNRGLCRLARPALQFSTSDGDRWYLTVHGGPHGQEHFLHEFGYHSNTHTPDGDAEQQARLDDEGEPPPVDPRLAFLEDERAGGAPRKRVPFDLIADGLTGVGATIPDEFRASVADLPYSAAANRYGEWHADQVVAALAAAGIPHDPAAVRTVLLWEGMTDGESENDLGNLPRLLSVLGLGGEWDEWVRQAESPPPPPAEALVPTPDLPPALPEDVFGPVLAIVEPAVLTPVAGGTVPLPLKSLTLTRFFVNACSKYEIAGVVLRVTVPPGVAVPPPTGEEAGGVERTPDGFRIGLRNHMWFGRRDLRGQLGKGLFRFLFHLPDGSVLDCAYALEGKPALTQRYRGRVIDETWHIGETYPPLTREILAEALDLAKHKDREKQKARDEAEAEVIVAVAAHDPNTSHSPVRRKGLTLSFKYDLGEILPQMLFRHRFRGYWDVAGVERELAEAYAKGVEIERQMRKAGAAAARKRAAPHDPDVLFDGACGRYWASDFARLTELEQEPREKCDADLAALGFRHAGDLVAKKQRDIVMRLHASADGRAYFVLLGKRTMYLGYEYFTRFADGSHLTTTTDTSKDSNPDALLFFKTCPGLDVTSLHAKHLWAVGRLAVARGTEGVVMDATLAGAVRELDAAFARRETPRGE